MGETFARVGQPRRGGKPRADRGTGNNRNAGKHGRNGTAGSHFSPRIISTIGTAATAKVVIAGAIITVIGGILDIAKKTN